MSPVDLASALSLRGRAEAIKHEWAAGTTPDARAALEADPELAGDRSLVLELAYEEFSLHCEAGRPPDPDAFCARFPAYRSVLRRMIAGHQMLDENPQMLDDAPAPPAPPDWPEPGRRVGDFTLLRELGRGTFARVFLASEASTGDRPVVVKLSGEGGAEARTLGQLAHPHIVPILSARLDPATGLAVVCMPYLGNATLDDLLNRAYLDADAPPPSRAGAILDAVRATACRGDPRVEVPAPDPVLEQGTYVQGVAYLGAQLAGALAFLHARGVCHRDLKPSNVLLSPDGRALLLDFNLSGEGWGAPAPPTPPCARRTPLGPSPLVRLGGTPRYAAPEQILALQRIPTDVPLDGRADLFSLGVILYELLTGRHPFGPVPANMPGPQLGALLLGRQQAGFRPLRRLNRKVDRRVARLVERCLALDPAARPGSAAEVAAGLKAYLARPLSRGRWRTRLPALLLAAGCLLLGLSFTAGWIAPRRSPEQAYRLGVSAYRGGDHLGAERFFEQYINDRPRDPRGYLARGHARLRRRQFHLAEADFKSADECRPNDGPTLFAVGYCLAMQEKHHEATAYYRLAIQADPESAAAYNNRGYSVLTAPARDDARLLDEAGGDFDQALRIDPRSQAAHYNRAMLAMERRNRTRDWVLSPQALEDIEAAVTEGPLRTRKLYGDAARLYALAARDEARYAILSLGLPTGTPPLDPLRCCALLTRRPAPWVAAKAERAVDHLSSAYDAGGEDLGNLAKDRTFQRLLGGNRRFLSLLALPPHPPAVAPPEVRLVEPVWDPAD